MFGVVSASETSLGFSEAIGQGTGGITALEYAVDTFKVLHWFRLSYKRQLVLEIWKRVFEALYSNVGVHIWQETLDEME